MPFEPLQKTLSTISFGDIAEADFLKAKHRAETMTKPITTTNENENKKDRLSERINLRLTEHEYLKLKSKADEQNLSISNFLRSVVLEIVPPISPIAMEKKVVNRVRDFPTIEPSLNRQIVSIGRNLNQITKLANSQNVAFGKIDVVSLVQSLDRITEELKLLRQQYIESNENAS